MINFKEFVTQQDQNVDSHEIEHLYDKAKIAINVVRMYDPKFLENISTIANLASGAYGMYNSGENKKIMPPDVEQNLIYRGNVTKDNIGNVPTSVIKQYFPDIDERTIRRGDTIHVNVNRILSQAKSDWEAVIQIASTIIHEATHEIERETKGQTFEQGPEGEERKFMSWVHQNIDKIKQQFPDLNENTENNKPFIVSKSQYAGVYSIVVVINGKRYTYYAHPSLDLKKIIAQFKHTAWPALNRLKKIAFDVDTPGGEEPKLKQKEFDF